MARNRLTWLLEADIYGEQLQPLVAAIKRQGFAVHFATFREIVRGNIAISPEEPVIFYGTFPAMRHIQLHYPWKPGGFCNSEALDCATYYAYFGKYLLNQNYVIQPVVEAIRQRDWLYSVVGVEDEVFVRPSGCPKVFTGRCVYIDDFADALMPATWDPTTLIVVAPPKDIGREWRFVVCQKQVIGGSQYANHLSPEILPEYPREVLDFVNGMVSTLSWQPDSLYMVDVCESDSDLKLVELNSFSCSWLYACDTDVIVEETAKLALQHLKQSEHSA